MTEQDANKVGQGVDGKAEAGKGCTLYLDCQSGVAGDMMVAALLDAGADEDAMRRALDSLPVDGFTYEVSHVERNGLDCCDFAVTLDDGCDGHDHDDEYLYGGIYPPRGPEEGRGPGPRPSAPPRGARPGECPPPPPPGGHRPYDCPPPPLKDGCSPHGPEGHEGLHGPDCAYDEQHEPYGPGYDCPPPPHEGKRPDGFSPQPSEGRRPGDCPPPPHERKHSGDCPPPPPDGHRQGDCPPPPPCSYDYAYGYRPAPAYPPAPYLSAPRPDDRRRPEDCPPPPPAPYPPAYGWAPAPYPPAAYPPVSAYPPAPPADRCPPPQDGRRPAPRPGDCPPPPPPEGRGPEDCPPPPPPEGRRPGDCPPPPPSEDGRRPHGLDGCDAPHDHEHDGPHDGHGPDDGQLGFDRGAPYGPAPDSRGPRPCGPGPQGPDAHIEGHDGPGSNVSGHNHGDGHPPEHDPHAHHHEHRGLAEIEDIINAADMTDGARELALRTFRILAEAESKAHGVPVDQVHFHEVGAVDSIVDIVAASALLDSLHVDRVVVPVLVDGRGYVRCQHGVIPVPVPATLNICMEHGLPLSQVPLMGELVTPTGAALVAALEPETDLPERYVVDAVGLGAGKRALPRPSVLRVMLIHEAPVREAQPVPPEGADSVCKLECDIDDATGEQLAYAADRLRGAGALEVHWLPVYTKKNRPAYQLQVICDAADVDRLELTIFRETTTLGVRCERMERTALERSVRSVDTAYGSVRVKCAVLPDGTLRSSPEYDDCAAIAEREGIPLQQVLDAARDAATRG